MHKTTTDKRQTCAIGELFGTEICRDRSGVRSDFPSRIASASHNVHSECMTCFPAIVHHLQNRGDSRVPIFRPGCSRNSYHRFKRIPNARYCIVDGGFADRCQTSETIYSTHNQDVHDESLPRATLVCTTLFSHAEVFIISQRWLCARRRCGNTRDWDTFCENSARKGNVGQLHTAQDFSSKANNMASSVNNRSGQTSRDPVCHQVGTQYLAVSEAVRFHRCDPYST